MNKGQDTYFARKVENIEEMFCDFKIILYFCGQKSVATNKRP